MEQTVKIQGSPILQKIAEAYNAGYRYIRLEGGTSAGKTYSLIQFLVYLAQTTEKRIDVVSPAMPHLKGGVMQDWADIMEQMGIYEEDRHNKTDHIYDYEGGRIKFASLDKPGKARGPRRDVLFVNEANLVNPDTFRQLTLRTSGTVILDYNPVEEESWVYERFDNDTDCCTIVCNYKDNLHFLNRETIKEIEALKDIDENLWKVYGLGKRGMTQGAVFRNWKLNYFPEEPQWIIYGLDFGYSHDPTCLVKVGLSQGELFFQNIIYEKGLMNDDIAIIAKQECGNATIIADSAEPKSIAELQRQGLNVKASKKGKDSIKNGINLLKQYRLNIDPDSKGAIKEAKSYVYKYHSGQDRYLNEPDDKNNHFWDAVRYAVQHKLTEKHIETFLA